MRLHDGTMAWLDAGDLAVELRGEATAEIEGALVHGEIYIAPEQMVTKPAGVAGVVIGTRPISLMEEDCAALPGADLPALGQPVRVGAVHGVIGALDPVGRRMTVVGRDGVATEFSVDDIDVD